MRARRLHPDGLALAALAVAWGGLWGAWAPHQTAGLTLSAFDLAYWAGVLPEVRSGALGAAPDALRLAAALAVVALGVSAGAIRNRWLRWALRAVAALPGLILLPPYPFVLDLWHSEAYGRRFVIAAGLWLGVAAGALSDRLPAPARRGLLAVLALAAAGLGAWAFAVLRPPFAARYAQPIPPGWGVVAFAGGLMLAAALSLFETARGLRAQPEPAPGGRAPGLKSRNGPVA